jgi:hypothetical protein
VVCHHPGAAAADAPGGWAAAEPAAWPAVLNVQNRTDVEYVCGALFPTLPRGSAALRLLCPPPFDPGEPPRLAAFAGYLRAKRRAGVVALPPAPGAPPRCLYLIPPGEEACRQLGLGWPLARGECMVALVAPVAESG